MAITKKQQEKVDNSQSVYLIVQYAHWCVRECELPMTESHRLPLNSSPD